IDVLEKWLRSYRPEELFTEEGKLVPELLEIAPKKERLMSLNPVTNGGKDVPALNLPNWQDYALDIEEPGSKNAQDMIELGGFVRDIIKENPTTFRIFGPDETASNRLQKVFEATNRQWLEPVNESADEFV